MSEVGRVEACAYTVPTDAPEADGTLTWDSTTLVLVEVEADGVVGTGWSYAPAAAVRLVHDQLAGEVTGRNALDVPGCYIAMVRAVRNAGRPGMASMAVSAVDLALWDLKARLLGLPLHRLLGAVHDQVPVYGSGGFTSYDDHRLIDQVTGWLDEGMNQVKIKVGESWGTRPGRDVARTRTVRELVGEDGAVFVDANGAFTVKQAVRFAERVRDHGVTWLEEPVSSDDLSGLATVRHAVGCDVTAGEYGFDLTYFERMCAAGAVDCLQVDVTRCGGITEWQRIAAVAAAHHLEVSGHCAPALHLSVAAATPNLRHLEHFHDHVRIERSLFGGLPQVTGGALVPTEEPGNGVTFQAARAEHLRVA